MSIPDLETVPIKQSLELGRELESAISNATTYYTTIDKLLSRGADPNFRMKSGKYTIFQYIIFHGRSEYVEKCLKRGADANSYFVHSHGMTVLQAAVIGRNVDTIKLLLQYGADINAVDDNGDTALHYCKMGLVSPSSSVREYYDLLVGKGAKTDIKNKRGLTVGERATEILECRDTDERPDEGHM